MAKVTAKDVIAKAKSYVGTKEVPSGSNNVIFNTHFYGRPVRGSSYPWCCAYVWDIFRMLGASDLFCGGAKVAYCPAVESYAINHKQWYKTGQAGDCGLMNFGDGGRSRHIGFIISKNSNGTYTTVEGNTGSTSQDNGGNVMIRTRKASDFRGFYRPNYTKSTANSTSTTAKPTTVKVAAAKKKSNSYVGKYVVKTPKSNDKLAVRSDAGEKFTQITTLANGKTVTCYGYFNIASDKVPWLYIATSDGKTGYVNSKYVTKK